MHQIDGALIFTDMSKTKGKGQIHDAKFFWIKASVVVRVNDVADELAKEAALRTKVDYDAFACSISYIKLEKWQMKYSTAAMAGTTEIFFPDVKKRSLQNPEINEVESGDFSNLHEASRFFIVLPSIKILTFT